MCYVLEAVQQDLWLQLGPVNWALKWLWQTKEILGAVDPGQGAMIIFGAIYRNFTVMIVDPFGRRFLVIP